MYNFVSSPLRFSNNFNQSASFGIKKNCLFNSETTVHFVIGSILKWNGNVIKYFLSNKILRTFSLKNKNRLKNLLSKFIFDKVFLLEIEKLIYVNLVDISSVEVV